MALRVTQAFAGHSVGDLISDADAVSAILASDQAAFVVPIADVATDAPKSPEE